MTNEADLGVLECDAPVQARAHHASRGARFVGEALFLGTCMQDGIEVRRVEHRCWTVVLPGRDPITGIDAVEAQVRIDRFLHEKDRDRG